MKEVQIGNKKKLQISRSKDQLLIDGVESDFKMEKISEDHYKVFTNKSIYTVDVIGRDDKKFSFSINNNPVEAEVFDHIDQVLSKLGMDVTTAKVVKEVKAPMPGSILDIVAEEGAEVKGGDQLLILEAMKMENVIKSPGEGVIEKIHISKNQNVEKNQVLITFK